MLLRMLLYVMIGYVAYRIIQLASRMMSTGRRRDENPPPHPPPPPAERFKDIQDADFEDITPKEKGPDTPKGS